MTRVTRTPGIETSITPWYCVYKSKVEVLLGIFYYSSHEIIKSEMSTTVTPISFTHCPKSDVSTV